MKKEKSKLERTPQKNDQGKRKSSPTKKESQSKKCKLTPQRESSIKSLKKEARVSQRGLDFKEQAAEALQQAGIDPGRRAETLSISEFIRVSEAFGSLAQGQ